MAMVISGVVLMAFTTISMLSVININMVSCFHVIVSYFMGSCLVLSQRRHIIAPVVVGF